MQNQQQHKENLHPHLYQPREDSWSQRESERARARERERERESERERERERTRERERGWGSEERPCFQSKPPEFVWEPHRNVFPLAAGWHSWHTHLQWRVDTGRPDLRRCQGFLVCTSLGSHLALSSAHFPSFISLFFQIYIEKENRAVSPVWQRSGKRKTDSEESEMSENIGMEISSGVDAVVEGGSPPCQGFWP